MSNERQEPVESSSAKPQRRTLVRVLGDLVRRVNADVLMPASHSETSSRYRNLLLATNAAERVLDRDRQHSRAKKESQS